ncbi:MAG: hypothetical protein ACI4EV_02685 [Lachnospiraceae bacterium]
MRIGNNAAGLQQYVNAMANHKNFADSRIQSTQKRQLLAALNSTTEKKEDYSSRIINESLQYAQSVSTARTNAKDAKLQAKKVRYNYKSISTQITRAKTSVSAKQVVIKAKRLVAQLKRQRASDEYDEDELQAAIDHAKAMERVAKKKVNHLIEEEMANAAGGVCLDEQETDLEEPVEAYEENVEENDEESLEAMEELYNDMETAMSDILEEDLMEELQDSVGVVVQKDIEPADLDMLKLKHRTKEQKEIARADARYLKAVFDKLQEVKENAVTAPSVQSGVQAGGIDICV